MRRIILASASPRRKALLKQIRLNFKVDPSRCSEHIDHNRTPHELAKHLSRKKASAVARRRRGDDEVIIAADTLVVLGGEIIGKPSTKAEAKTILTTISGKQLSVITGFTVVDTREDKTVSESVETLVDVRELSEEEIAAYVESGEPLDKAGALGVQGRGAIFVERIEGDYFNMIGLPLCTLAAVLKNEFGISSL